MKKILILGALPTNKQRKEVYNAIIVVSKDFAKEVDSPLDTAQFEGEDKKRYERAMKNVKESDLVIAELSEPSTGSGIEIREAAHLKKKLLIIAKDGAEVSGLVKGSPDLTDMIVYKNIQELKAKLQETLFNYVD